MSLYEAPPTPVPPRASENLREAERAAWRGAAYLALGAIAATLGAVVTSMALLWGIAAGCTLVAFFFALNARRARRVRSALATGCLSALTVGWTRAPDGCNIALFLPNADPATSEPEFVVRLGTVRPTTTAQAVVVGDVRPLRAVAIITTDGDVLGVGRVRAKANGQRVWARRHRGVPWWSASSGRELPPSE